MEIAKLVVGWQEAFNLMCTVVALPIAAPRVRNDDKSSFVASKQMLDEAHTHTHTHTERKFMFEVKIALWGTMGPEGTKAGCMDYSTLLYTHGVEQTLV
jgi:hypothetical protein